MLRSLLRPDSVQFGDLFLFFSGIARHRRSRAVARTNVYGSNLAGKVFSHEADCSDVHASCHSSHYNVFGSFRVLGFVYYCIPDNLAMGVSMELVDED